MLQKFDTDKCKNNGWILQATPHDLEIFKSLMIKPSLIIALDMRDHLIYEKLEQRRYDPVTGTYHYIMIEDIKNETILNRLVQKQEDTHPQIKKKLIEYREFMHQIFG